jgi:hypothetical protein
MAMLSSGSVRRCAVASTAVVLLGATLAAQPPGGSFTDLAAELAERIVAALAKNAPAVAATVKAADDPAEQTGIMRDVARELTTRGIRVTGGAPSAGGAVVIVGCGENLRERSCVADIRRGDAHEVVAAVKPYVGSPDSGRSLHFLEATPVVGQTSPILDIAVTTDRLLVLDPSAVTVYRRSADTWQRVESRPLAPARTWPRDVRGRLRVAGSTVDAFLPATVCRATIESSIISCVDHRDAWPLPVDNSGLDAVRNTFQTPEGVTFVSAAVLDGETDARAAIVDGSGNLALLGESRAPIATIGKADDLAAVSVCGGGTHLLTSTRTAGAATDSLTLWRIVGRRTVAAATPLVVPGRITALWAAPGAPEATLVVHDAGAGRYEAFQVRVACAR